jgi:hypothetical protein
MDNTSMQEAQQYSDLVLCAALDRILDEWLSAQTDDACPSSAQPTTSATLSPSSENNVNTLASDSQMAMTESGGAGAPNMTPARTDPGSSSFPLTFDPVPWLEDSTQIDFAVWNEYDSLMETSAEAYRGSRLEYLGPNNSMQS